MSDYRPSMGGMRKAYHRWAIVNENVVAPSELDAEFDRFIAKIRADAWDEGWSAGYTDAVYDEHPQATGRHEPNPHMIEGEA